tara:strand:- start:584 stop:1090 length:507 start_codon:yes stop_codon:yes gene_type:complete
MVLITTMGMGQSLKPDAASSKIAFTIKNLGINTTGYFKDISGTIVFDLKNPTSAKFDIEIPTKSLDTDNNLRDSHLSKEEYFHVSQYPNIKFTSTKVTATKPGQYIVEGKLTIKNTTKNISFPFTANAQEGGILFKGTLPLNRRDYSVGGRSFTLSDNLTLNLTVLAK